MLDELAYFVLARSQSLAMKDWKERAVELEQARSPVKSSCYVDYERVADMTPGAWGFVERKDAGLHEMCRFQRDGAFSFGDGKCACPCCLQDEAVLSPRMPFSWVKNMGRKDVIDP